MPREDPRPLYCAVALWQPAVLVEERQGKPRLQQKPLEQLSKSRQRPGWLRWLAARSALGCPRPLLSRETLWLLPASGLPVTGQRWGGGGGTVVVAATQWPSVSSQPRMCWRLTGPRGCCRREAGRVAVWGLVKGTHCPLPCSCAEREIPLLSGSQNSGEVQPWLCCLSSCLLPGSACSPGTGGLVLLAWDDKVGSSSGQALWNRAGQLGSHQCWWPLHPSPVPAGPASWADCTAGLRAATEMLVHCQSHVLPCAAQHQPGQ